MQASIKQHSDAPVNVLLMDKGKNQTGGGVER